MDMTCAHCGNAYSRPPSLAGSFCSKRCAYDARRKDRTDHRRMRREPDHPLASKSGYISEARAVLYAKIGPGAHPCYWCQVEVLWHRDTRGQPKGVLVADHVNGDHLDDSIDNLVPACGRCNIHRNRPKTFSVTTHACEDCQRSVHTAYRPKLPILCRNCKRRRARQNSTIV